MNKRKKFVSVLAGIMAAVLLLSLILSVLPQARAASSSEIKNQIQALQEQKAEIRNQMGELTSSYSKTEDEIADLVAQKGTIDQQIFLLNTQIDLINDQIQAYNLLIADKQEELEKAQKRLNELNAKHKDRIRTMEEEGQLSYWSVVFNASSLSDLLDRLNMIQEIAASDRRRLKELSDAAALVEEARLALEQERAELELTLAELDASYTELEGKKQESDAMIASLVKKMEEIDGLQADFEAREAELLLQIAAQEKAYTEAQRQEWLDYLATATTAPTESTQAPTQGPVQPKPTQPQGTKPGQDTPSATEPAVTEPPVTETPTEPPTEPKEPEKVVWLRPCSYVRLSSPFGEREAPTEGASTFHQGVDLAGAEGTPIVASRSGTVTTATFSNSAGYYVLINHGDGYSSVYMHMTGYLVSPGEKVSAGQTIGYMGSTGISTGPHLHFGIMHNGGYVNPAYYVSL